MNIKRRVMMTVVTTSVLFGSVGVVNATEAEPQVEITVENEEGSKTYTYELSELLCGYIDEDGNLVEIPVVYSYDVAATTIAQGKTFEWYPSSDKNGFKLKKNDVVTVSLNLDTAVRIKIGLTNGNSRETTDKSPSVDLVQNSDGYSKMYVTNLSSSSVKVKGGTISYNE